MATSGSTVSHLRMWYSIHSRLMVMSPSKNLKRGSCSRSSTRSACMSMPYTSQSVSARMRFERWWPMKPFTPRIRIRFITAEFSSRFSFLDFEKAQDFTIAADGEPFAALLERSGGAAGHAAAFEPGLMYEEAVAERAGERRRHRAHQVVDLLGAPHPVDAAVLRAAAAEVA